MMKIIFTDLLNCIFPQICIGCGMRLSDSEQYICFGCLTKLPRTKNYKIPNNKLELFFAGRFPFLHIASFAYFNKEGLVQKLIHELKYKNNPLLGVYLGELCGRELQGSSFLESIDFIIPVPIHPNRKKKRGYNQALKLAEGMSRQTGIPIEAENLVRIIDNPSQTKRNRVERWTNVADIFAVQDPSLFENKHILLLDDIVTTGSTLESCVKELIKTENIKISIYAIGVAV